MMTAKFFTSTEFNNLQDLASAEKTVTTRKATIEWDFDDELFKSKHRGLQYIRDSLVKFESEIDNVVEEIGGVGYMIGMSTDYEGVISVYVVSEETDQEYTARQKKMEDARVRSDRAKEAAKKRKEKALEKERELYEQLKAKFEGAQDEMVR